jgi:plasmid stability protein
MAQFIVRNLEDSVKQRLKRRADRNGRSVEEEIRQILRNATRDDGRVPMALGSRIASRFKGLGLTAELPEARGEAAKPAPLER